MPSDPKPQRPPKPLPVPESVFWKPPSYCRGCQAEIWWWKNPQTGSNVPVNADSTSHFATCPKREDFRKQAREREGR